MISKTSELGQLWIKMTLLTSAFQRVARSKKVTRGQKSQNRSNFEIFLNKVNYISKWRSWSQLFKKESREVTRSHKLCCHIMYNCAEKCVSISLINSSEYLKTIYLVHGWPTWFFSRDSHWKRRAEFLQSNRKKKRIEKEKWFSRSKTSALRNLWLNQIC